MKYISTRDNSKEYNFEQVFIKGLADDGGLFVPKKIKAYTDQELNVLSDLGYQDLAKKILLILDYYYYHCIFHHLPRCYNAHRNQHQIMIPHFQI